LPVRNEGKFIVNCLQSIAAQDYPKDCMELLIVDGLSDDDTLEKINKFKVQSSKFKDIRVLENPKRVVSSARNIGIKKTAGDIMVCMDAHALYSPDYISSCVQVMEQTGAANVGGPALALPGGPGPMAQAITMAHYSPFGLGGAQFRDPNAEGLVETVWPGCFKREVFDKVGYIDERRTRTEDIEFNARLRGAGYKIYLSPLIKACYYCRTTLGETWRQRWADGYEITHFLPDNPKVPRLRHFVPLLFVASLILLTALSLSGLGAALWGHGAGTKLANLLHGLKGAGIKEPGLFSLKAWSWHLLFLRMLVLELFAYLGAMALFVIQAGKRQYKVHKVEKVESITQDGVAQAQGTTSPGLSTLGLSDFRPAPGSLALLPLVFVTLHFSYGLGSLWGLITLPFISTRLKVQS
jgi:GT2 family glycosyltransferase